MMVFKLAEYTKEGYTYFNIGLSTPYEDPEDPYTVFSFGLCKRSWHFHIPQLFKPKAVKVVPMWDAETIARLGRDYYMHYTRKEYSLTVWSEDIQVHYGTQPGGWERGKPELSNHVKCFSYPWQLVHVGQNIYTLGGFPVPYEQWEPVDSNKYNTSDREVAWSHDFFGGTYHFFTHIDSFDGEAVSAKAHVSERTWHRGVNRFFKFFKYLPGGKLTIRSLEVEFRTGVGSRKVHSWKGGTTGCSTPMLEGETITEAVARFNRVWSA